MRGYSNVRGLGDRQRAGQDLLLQRLPRTFDYSHQSGSPLYRGFLSFCHFGGVTILAKMHLRQERGRLAASQAVLLKARGILQPCYPRSTEY